MPAKQNSVLREAAMLAIPTIFDVAATVLMNVGLLSVTASVYQMVRHLALQFGAGSKPAQVLVLQT